MSIKPSKGEIKTKKLLQVRKLLGAEKVARKRKSCQKNEKLPKRCRATCGQAYSRHSREIEVSGQPVQNGAQILKIAWHPERFERNYTISMRSPSSKATSNKHLAL